MQKINKKPDTSWNKVANWYKNTIDNKFSYQKEILLPNLLKVLPSKKVENKNILEIGCGTGMFLENYANAHKIVGVDLSKELIDIAKNNFNNKTNHNFYCASADNMHFLKEPEFDFITSIESLSNMENLDKVSSEVFRLLKKEGEFIMIINHPAFRIPQHSDWHYDKARDEQGRVMYKYMSKEAIKIDMNPGEKILKNKKYTYTFHRPVSDYINNFCKYGLKLNLCLEICSTKKSQSGPKKKAEDKARTEIPMFLLLRFQK